MFRTSKHQTTVDGIPNIYISRRALLDMWALVTEVSTEIGWLGSVSVLEDRSFLIERIYLLKQQVGAATTEIDGEGLASAFTEILQQPGGGDEAQRIRFWGHSHVDMGVSPSQQDDKQMALFDENGCDWFIRGIFNKKKEVRLDIFYYTTGLVCLDCDWEVMEDPEEMRREHWKQEIEAKVSRIVYTPMVTAYQGHTQPNPPYQHRLIEDDDGITLIPHPFTNPPPMGDDMILDPLTPEEEEEMIEALEKNDALAISKFIELDRKRQAARDRRALDRLHARNMGAQP